MNSTDYSRPSGFARWGWITAALNVLLALSNLVLIAFADGNWANWFAAAFCGGCAYACWWMWRDGVQSDATFRSNMAAFDRDWRHEL